MWVRGLKLFNLETSITRYPSHPMWVRGLKQVEHRQADFAEKVAPYVGAWIETKRGYNVGRLEEVAPYVGAWIETV